MIPVPDHRLQPACDWLIPLRPHIVGNALADLVAVVKPGLAHQPGLSAWQPVTTGERERAEVDRGEIERCKRTENKRVEGKKG